MVKEIAPTALIVMSFEQAFNVKFAYGKRGQQLGGARALLKTYSLDDVLVVLDYMKAYPIKSRITSVHYLKYIMEQKLPLAKAWRKSEEEKKATTFTDIEVNVTNKARAKKRQFRGEF